MTTENTATIKVVAKQLKEYNDLLIQHNALMVVHTKTVNAFADKSLAYGELKKVNKETKRLLLDSQLMCRTLAINNSELVKIIVQWENENKILQESLEACQRALEEME